MWVEDNKVCDRHLSQNSFNSWREHRLDLCLQKGSVVWSSRVNLPSLCLPLHTSLYSISTSVSLLQIPLFTVIVLLSFSLTTWCSAAVPQHKDQSPNLPQPKSSSKRPKVTVVSPPRLMLVLFSSPVLPLCIWKPMSYLQYSLNVHSIRIILTNLL